MRSFEFRNSENFHDSSSKIIHLSEFGKSATSSAVTPYYSLAYTADKLYESLKYETIEACKLEFNLALELLNLVKVELSMMGSKFGGVSW